jgi:hypothetical protein
MELEDVLEPEVAAAAAVVAAVASPQVRRAVRRGAIYGLAGVIVAGDAVTSFVRGMGRGMQAANGGASAGPHAAHSASSHPDEQSTPTEVH